MSEVGLRNPPRMTKIEKMNSTVRSWTQKCSPHCHFPRKSFLEPQISPPGGSAGFRLSWVPISSHLCSDPRCSLAHSVLSDRLVVSAEQQPALPHWFHDELVSAYWFLSPLYATLADLWVTDYTRGAWTLHIAAPLPGGSEESQLTSPNTFCRCKGCSGLPIILSVWACVVQSKLTTQFSSS